MHLSVGVRRSVCFHPYPSTFRLRAGFGWTPPVLSNPKEDITSVNPISVLSSCAREGEFTSVQPKQADRANTPDEIDHN